MFIRNILLPTDLTDDHRAVVPLGAALARAFEASIVLFHAVDVETLGKYGERTAARQDLIEDGERFARERLRRIEALPALEGITTSREIATTADVVASILEAARDAAADLILLPTRTKPGLRRLVMGSVAEQVIRASSVPVLVSHRPDGEAPASTPPAVRLERILAPTDLSPHADRAAGHALELARAFGARVEVLHVFEETIPAGMQLAGIGSVLELKPELDKAIHESLEKKAAALFADVPHATHLVTGRPAAGIVDFAREPGIDLIAMATHGHDSVGDHFFGSTTDRVVRTAPCPVYVVPPATG